MDLILEHLDCPWLIQRPRASLLTDKMTKLMNGPATPGKKCTAGEGGTAKILWSHVTDSKRERERVRTVVFGLK